MSEPPTPEPLYRIEEVAERTGLTKRTLRYYEEIGLLKPPARTEGNYRLYTANDIQRIQRITQLRDALGLSLAEIETFLRVEEARDLLRASYKQENDVETHRQQLIQARALAHQQLAIVDAKLHTIQEVRDELHARLERYAAALRQLEADQPEP